MAEIVLNKIFNASDVSDIRVLGAFAAQGGVISGAPNTGALLSDLVVSGTTGAFSGATATVTNLLQAGWIVKGVTIYVSTAITSAAATTMTIGHSGDIDNWGTGILFAAGTTTTSANWTAGPFFMTTTRDLVFTPNTGTFTGGVVRYTVFYQVAGAPPKP